MSAFAKALSEGTFSVEKVCTDCVMLTENDDPSGLPDGYDDEPRMSVLMAYDVTIGHPHMGEWSDDCSHSGSECEEDCDCTRDEFSTIPCGMCGSPLAGERHDYIFIRHDVLKAGTFTIECDVV